MEKKIKVTYSSTNEKTIEEVVRNLIETHRKIKNDNDTDSIKKKTASR